MTFCIQDQITGKFAKNAIDRKILTFEDRDFAEKFASNMQITANTTIRNFSNTRLRRKYVVVERA